MAVLRRNAYRRFRLASTSASSRVATNPSSTRLNLFLFQGITIRCHQEVNGWHSHLEEGSGSSGTDSSVYLGKMMVGEGMVLRGLGCSKKVPSVFTSGLWFKICTNCVRRYRHNRGLSRSCARRR